MRTFKKILLHLLMVIVLSTAWNMSARAEDENISWKLEDGVLTISGSGAVPDYEAGKSPWYNDRSSIKEIQVESGITRVGNYAFYYSSCVEKVTLAETVTSIGDHAFDCNDVLGSVNMPGVTTIGDYAFSNCYRLSDSEWTAQLTEIGDYAFYMCEDLGDVSFSDCLTTIGDYAFSRCYSIEQLELPQSLTTVGNYTFEYCTGLENVSLPDEMTSLGASMFKGCSALTQVKLPESLTGIPQSIFYDCENLVWVWIPDGVKEIGRSAFEHCARMERILIPGSVTTIGYGAFYNCLNLASGCYFGEEAGWKKVSVAGCNEPLLNVTMEYDPHVYSSYTILQERKCTENGVVKCISADGTERTEMLQALGHNYIKGNDSTSWVCAECNEEVKTDEGTLEYGSLGPNLTWQLSQEGVLKISGSGPMINSDADMTVPWYNQRLSVVCAVIEDGVTNLGDHAFYYHINLNAVSLPDSMTTIGKNSFDDCKKLAEVNLPESLVKIDNKAFATCPLLTVVNLPDTVETVGDYAFYDDDGLTRVEFPKGLTSIGKWAFYSCDNLAEAVINSGKCTVGEGAFGQCASGLTLWGVKGSAVETYATENGITFETLEGEVHEHSFTNYVSDKNATCTKDGTKTAKCDSCDMTDTIKDDGSATGHNWGKGVVTKATTSKNGKITYTCSECKQTKSTTIYYPKTVTLSTTSYTYNGKVKKPTVTAKNSAGKTISSSNYTVSYAEGRKNVGRYAVKVTFKGNYSGSLTKYFTIKPKSTSISSLTKATKAFTVKWKKPTSMYRKQMTGYQIRYSTSSKMTSAKMVTVKSTTATSKKISNLKAKKYYYVQLRTYKKIDSKYYYSGWSSVKKVKTR